jgi:hypothetical protein
MFITISTGHQKQVVAGFLCLQQITVATVAVVLKSLLQI